MTDTTPNRTSDFAILYVDDEDMALKYFQRAMARQATVHTASSVDAAMELLASEGERIGVLVTDQRMPGRTGVDLLRAVRRDHPGIVRLLTTAYSDLDDAIEAVNRGEIFRYITKPWDIKLLQSELRQAMEVFHLRREHALLSSEKLGVARRQVAVNRLRDLIVMGASFAHLRNGVAAMAAYCRDHLADLAAAEAAAGDVLDPWQLLEHELDHATAVAGELVAITDVPGGHEFDSEISAGELLVDESTAGTPITDAGGTTDPRLRVNTALARLLVDAVVDGLAGSPVTVSRSEATLSDHPAVVYEITAERPDAASPEAAPQRVAAYLIAAHHGGRLERTATGFRLTLPGDPEAVPALSPPRYWLEDTLMAMEDY